MKTLFLVLTLVLALLTNGLAQAQQSSSTSPSPALATPASPQATPSPSPPPSTAPTAPVRDPNSDSDTDVVQITTNLVQVDATVTDKDGKYVTGLKAEDFEITENGRSQPITNFSYISTTPAPTPSPSNSPTPKPAKDASKSPPIKIGRVGPLRPEQIRRAIALVVDDMRMSTEGIHSTRQALKKFVEEQTQHGDLVAIIRTSGGMGALQQFTSDPEQLQAAIERVKPIARAGARPGAFTSISMLDRLETQILDGSPDEGEAGADRRRREGTTSGAAASSLRGTEQSRLQGINELRDTLFTVGTLGALNFVVRGLKDLPGRKAAVLFSDGISIFNSDSNAGDRSGRVMEAMRQLVDHANRASVVIYSIDTRGLQPTMQASDNTTGGPLLSNPGGLPSAMTGVGNITPDLYGQQVLGARTAELFEGQNGLSYLARETGGIAVFNNNDLNRGIRRALEDINGYYLIGYRPEEASFETSSGQRRFNSWSIKVKDRPNLKVRTRGGFIGFAEEQARNRNRTPGEQLMAALLSPFSVRGLDLKLTSVFMNDATLGSTMKSMLLMDAENLTFTRRPDGKFETVFNVIAVTLGDTGAVTDQITRVEKIIASPEQLERFVSEGMVYGLNIPISKPGAYMLRIAVRDAASGKIGSASQYIEVPNVSKDRMTLSSLIISGNNPEGGLRPKTAKELLKSVLAMAASAGDKSPVSVATTAPIIVAGGEGMVGTEDPKASPASRLFRTKMFLNFACILYNGKDGKAKGPFTTQVRLFHEGREVFDGGPVPLDMSQQADMKRLVVTRRLFLGTVLTEGDYVLHLTVTNQSGSGDSKYATRWVDFKVVNQHASR